MINWNQSPFIRLLIPLILGISVANFIAFEVGMWIYYALILLILLFIISLSFSFRSSYKYRRIAGIIINAMIFFAGLILAQQQNYHANVTEESEVLNIFLQTTEPSIEKANSFKVKAKIISENNSFSEKVIIYLEKDERANALQYGDLIIANCHFQEVKPPQNPDEFNYKKFLIRKGIYLQAYIPKDNWTKIGSGKGYTIIAFGYQLRNKLLHILEENKLTGKEYAVAAAILLGFDDKLDRELVQEFSGSGAMHILCVSGLHVGIIYFIFSSILFLLNQKKWQRLLKTFLLLLLIWVYAMITGFSPSVLRASTMFSFIIVGQSINRRSNIYNSLAASAFLLLIFNSNFIFEVGFQLSYLAVLGIVSIYPLLYKIWIPKNLLLKKIWSLVVVSIVAQIATFPLSLYYFHQFPNYFIFTNLAAIPASTIILYSGLLVLIFSPAPVISSLFAKTLSWTIYGLNTTVKLIENAPFSTLSDIQISSFETTLFYLLIISLFIAISQKRKSILIASIGLFILINVSFTVRKYENLHQQKITVYCIQNNTALEFVSGKQGILLSDSILQLNPYKQNFHIKNHTIATGIDESYDFRLDEKDIYMDFLYRKGNFVLFNNKRLLIIDKEYRMETGKTKTHLDYIILTENPPIEIKTLADNFEFNQLIFTSSTKNWQIQKWIEECELAGINYYDVNQEGAWQVKL